MSEIPSRDSPLIKATLGLRFLLEALLIAGIVVAARDNYDGATAWVAAVVGVVLTLGLWTVFAVPGDPSRSGRTVIVTPGWARLVIELGLFVAVSVWLALGESYVVAALLAGGAVVHYASWPARIRWLLAN